MPVFPTLRLLPRLMSCGVVCSQSSVFTFGGTASLRHRARQLRETTEHFVDPALLVQAVKHLLLSVVICEMGPFHAWVGRLRGAAP